MNQRWSGRIFCLEDLCLTGTPEIMHEVGICFMRVKVVLKSLFTDCLWVAMEKQNSNYTADKSSYTTTGQSN